MKSERTIRLMLAFLAGQAMRASEDDDEDTRQSLVDMGEVLVWVLSDQQPELIPSPITGEISGLLNEFQKVFESGKN